MSASATDCKKRIDQDIKALANDPVRAAALSELLASIDTKHKQVSVSSLWPEAKALGLYILRKPYLDNCDEENTCDYCDDDTIGDPVAASPTGQSGQSSGSGFYRGYRYASLDMVYFARRLPSKLEWGQEEEMKDPPSVQIKHLTETKLCEACAHEYLERRQNKSVRSKFNTCAEQFMKPAGPQGAQGALLGQTLKAVGVAAQEKTQAQAKQFKDLFAQMSAFTQAEAKWQSVCKIRRQATRDISNCGTNGPKGLKRSLVAEQAVKNLAIADFATAKARKELYTLITQVTTITKSELKATQAAQVAAQTSAIEPVSPLGQLELLEPLEPLEPLANRKIHKEFANLLNEQFLLIKKQLESNSLQDYDVCLTDLDEFSGAKCTECNNYRQDGVQCSDEEENWSGDDDDDDNDDVKAKDTKAKIGNNDKANNNDDNDSDDSEKDHELATYILPNHTSRERNLANLDKTVFPTDKFKSLFEVILCRKCYHQHYEQRVLGRQYKMAMGLHLNHLENIQRQCTSPDTVPFVWQHGQNGSPDSGTDGKLADGGNSKNTKRKIDFEGTNVTADAGGKRQKTQSTSQVAVTTVVPIAAAAAAVVGSASIDEI